MLKNLKYPLAPLLLSSSIYSVIPSNSVQASEGDTSPRVVHEKQGQLDITTYYYDENPLDYDFKTEENIVSPYYIPYDGTEYNMMKKTLYKSKAWGTEVRNASSEKDSVYRSVTRTTFANGTLGGSGETALNWGVLKGKVGIQAEVAWGKSTTTTVAYTINFAPKKITTVAIGTKAVETSGMILTYSRGTVIKKTPVAVKYSYDDYMDVSEKPL